MKKRKFKLLCLMLAVFMIFALIPVLAVEEVVVEKELDLCDLTVDEIAVVEDLCCTDCRIGGIPFGIKEIIEGFDSWMTVKQSCHCFRFTLLARDIWHNVHTSPCGAGCFREFGSLYICSCGMSVHFVGSGQKVHWICIPPDR